MTIPEESCPNDDLYDEEESGLGDLLVFEYLLDTSIRARLQYALNSESSESKKALYKSNHHSAVAKSNLACFLFLP